MVDKEKRRVAAGLIEDLFAGRITNYEYDDRYPKSEQDPALHAIYTLLWFGYSDVREHRIKPEKLTRDSKEVLARIGLFLGSDFEYTGQRDFIDPFSLPKRIWHWITRRPVPPFPSQWPFESDEQLDTARASLG